TRRSWKSLDAWTQSRSVLANAGCQSVQLGDASTQSCHHKRPGNTARFSIPCGDPLAAVPQLPDFEAGGGGSTETRVRVLLGIEKITLVGFVANTCVEDMERARVKRRKRGGEPRPH